MKSRVVFRSFIIMLAAVMLLSSTSAYNILVYANQDSVADSLSAIESSTDAAVTEPNIAVQGGTLELNADGDSTETETTVEWLGEGTEQNPYQISSVEHFLEVNAMVNGTKTVHHADQKHFVLTADIDLAGWFAAHNDDTNTPPYVNVATNAYLISTDASNVNEYINIDGSYTVDGVTYKHKIYISDSTTVAVKNYEHFALFGYLSSNSVVSNIIFENINVNVTAPSPQRMAIISYFNEGAIENCELVDCSITVAYNESKDSVNGAGSSTAYYGIAGAVADNRARVSGVKADNFTLSLSPDTNYVVTNDYIGGLVAQNRGTVENSAVSGIKLEVSDRNHYVGGMVAYNAGEILGSSVNMAGSDNVTNNISGGGFVGGLVGYNDTGATITDSSVTGTFTSVQSPSFNGYNIYAKADSNNSISDTDFLQNNIETPASFGGIAGVNKGSIEKSTVSDLGVYLGIGETSNSGYFGGIAAMSSGGSISASVASGSFVAASSSACRAGGIVGYAKSTDTQIISDCYALVKLNVPSADLVGAVVGYGGNSNTAVNCYWSDAISGCVTSYVIPDSNTLKPASIEPAVGNLNSQNRAVTVSRGIPKTVYASELVHSFTKMDGATIGVATVSTNADVQIAASNANNSWSQKAYTVSFSFPVDSLGVALVGSSDKQVMEVAINLDVFVTSASGDPDSQSDPLVISASSMAKYISLSPYGHYKIGTDLSVTSGSWNKCIFTGTIDGNDKLISTDTSLFKYVIGSRNVKPEKDANNVTSPDNDKANRSMGYINNLTVELSGNIKTAVFGTVYNSTFVDVDLTDGDPTPDDGNSASSEGYIAQISDSYTAAFINCAVGYSYIYGCSTDVSVEFGNIANAAAFIAYLKGSVIVDNCAVNSVGAYVGEQDTAEKAVFLGNVVDNNGGFVLNSIVSARVIGGSGKCYVVMGPNGNQFVGYYKNITWSKMQYSSKETDSPNMNTADVALWGSSDKSYASIVKSVTASSLSTYSIAIPKYVDAFENASIGDFSISFVQITDGAETAYTGSKFTFESTAVENNELVLDVKVSSDALENDCVWVKVQHYETGFLTYVKYQVIIEEFSRGDDGYYHISTPADLIAFSELTGNNDTPEYLTYAYKIDNDIDMKGYEYTPAASGVNPFTGYIDGMGENGEVYTIKNLTISGSGNVALIAAAVSGGTVTVSDKDGNVTTLQSGISNIRFENINITATGEDANAAVLLGTANSTATTTYGQLSISGIEIVDSSVVSAGKNTAAVLADTVNCNIDISAVSLTNVSVQTTYSITTEGYFNTTESAKVGGLGGIIGTVGDTLASSEQSHLVDVTDVKINGLTVSGLLENEKAYATVNAGAIVGTYLKRFNSTAMSNGTISVPKLTIGDASVQDDDIVINDLVVMSAGMTGGVVGAANAQTVISNVKISSTTETNSQILSTTQYFIGGIAGHIGSYDADGATDEYAAANLYGRISNCAVENTDIVAANSAISTAGALSRNIAVGGIAGAINGSADANTVENCTVSDSRIEGVVVGGIVGSNIERTFVDGNRIHIVNCNVLNSKVTTPQTCCSVDVSYTSAVASFGVGGILGTNRYSQTSYASDVAVSYCKVGAGTEINNYTVYNDNTYVATGGIIGSAVTYYDDTVPESIDLQYNEVAASVYTLADAKVEAAVAFSYAPTAVRIGSGGFVGMFGSVDNSLSGVTDIAYFSYVSIADSVFSGSVVSADCIGGAIGSVINSTTCIEDYGEFIPETPILDNIVISGLLTSTSESGDALIRGGVAIGHIVYSVNPVGESYFATFEPYAVQVELGSTIETVFSDIYYSSFELDTAKFPLMGYCGLDPQSYSSYDSYVYPITDDANATLANSYIDVNAGTDNVTVQLADKQNIAQEFTISGASAPLVDRGMFTLGAVNGVQSKWQTSNKSIATVSDTTYETVTVTPRSKSDTAVKISIDYCGVITDGGDWSVMSYLPVGFLLFSTAEKVLEYVEVDGVKYYLISEPLDFNYIEMGNNYWLKNDIEFSDELFDATGIFADGFAPLGKESAPFTGYFGSMPTGKSYTVHYGSTTYTYESEKSVYTISGLELGLGTAKASDGTTVNYGTYSVAGLFGYVNGATFENFNICDVTSAAAADYAAAVAAVVSGSLTANSVVVENANISGAKYSGGLFGGMFSGSDADTPWQVKDCSLLGTRTGNGESAAYSTVISATDGAAGIAVHTDTNAAVFSGITVQGSYISQAAASCDTTTFDRGAAGISLAYSGTVSALEEKRNTIESCYIVGEIAAGAVVRSYSSASATAFTSGTIKTATSIAELLSISAVDVKSSHIVGNTTQKTGNTVNKPVASSGVLARAACASISHTVTDCSVDKDTVVEAPLAVGGIVGTMEESTSSTAATVNSYQINITVDNCKVSSVLKMTNGTVVDSHKSTDMFNNMGAGGIFGVIPRQTATNGIIIRNCIVDGVISGISAIGGIVGGMWSRAQTTAPDSMLPSKRTTHMIENCVVSADFATVAGEEAFAAANATTGIIIGYVYDASNTETSAADIIFGAAASAGLNDSNYPFYNLYYSGYKYPAGSTYLFGVINPGTNASQNSLNYNTTYGYTCYTNYIYDMDFYTENPVSIDTTHHCIVLPEEYRVQRTESEEDGIWVIDYRTLGLGMKFNLAEDFTFKASPKAGETSALTYRFDADASLSKFVLSASAGSTQTSVAELVEIKASSSNVRIEKGEGEGTYVLSTVSKPAKTFNFDVIFVYSNGLELVAPFRIEVSDGDYYFAPNEKGGNNYYIFNAANLNSTLQLSLSENDNVIQCFDVFWTADNTTVTDAANAYISDVTLAQAYSGVTFGGTDILTLLASVQHPNPEYDSQLGNAENLSISDYLGLSADESLGDVTLRRLVKEINSVSYGAYGTKGDSALYEGDFAGTYTVLQAVAADKNTGLTAEGEYYSVYGLELHAVNTSAQKADASHTGLFRSLAAGAEVTGLTFVNPRIEVVGAKGNDNFAGVLAGAAVGATIKDVSVERYQDGDKAYLSSIRWMTAANTFAGGIVGHADSATSITNCSVDGLDVVAASLAGNNSTTLKTVMAGGIVGSSAAVITDATVANSRILVERNDRYRNFYLSYAGGIAAHATNKLTNVTVTDTVMRDCTCDVIADDSNSYSTYSYTDNALVADRIGGVVAYTDGSLSIETAKVSGLTVRAFDIAGGVIAAVENNAEAEIAISGCSVKTSLDEGEGIRVYGSSNIAASSALRQYYNTAGGIVGKIDNLKSLNFTTCDFDGYVGTYSYDNLNKDCTAGGIIGFVTDALESLDAVTVYNSTVSGEVAGYYSSKTGSMVPYLGAAGGIIGKVNTAESKIGTDKMVSECVMGAKVNLYNSANGTLVNANLSDPANSPSTNVGKILGTLVSAVTDDDGNTASSNFALEAEDISIYFSNIYV